MERAYSVSALQRRRMEDLAGFLTLPRCVWMDRNPRMAPNRALARVQQELDRKSLLFYTNNTQLARMPFAFSEETLKMCFRHGKHSVSEAGKVALAYQESLALEAMREFNLLYFCAQ